MRTAVEISLYPLDADYVPPIKDFIERLNAYPDLDVVTNAMSTQVAGEHELVFPALEQETAGRSKAERRAVFVHEGARRHADVGRTLTLLDPVLGAFAAVPAVEWVAAGLALGYLGFAIRQNAWCWACAIASALLYLVVFARAGLVMQAALQVFYIGMSVYGWRAWRGSASAEPLAVGRWPVRQHALAWAAIAVFAR